jgi:hypothetical protein
MDDGAQVMPIQVKPVSAKDGTATFNDVAVSPSFVSVAFDPTGKWEANSPPPSGSSLGLHADSSGKPAPVTVTADKAATVTLKFDDSIKVP